jgi:hypothetical protein
MNATTVAAPVMAMSTARDNAELIEQAAQLGYLRRSWNTLDPTYGLGRFWTRWRPDYLVASDLNPAKSPYGTPVDFQHLPWTARVFNAVVLDAPYKLNGTSTRRGAATSDEDYGVDTWLSQADRHALIRRGIDECIRVLIPGRKTDPADGGYLLVKCQDQVNGGKVRWQTREFADHAETHDGVRLVDMLHLVGYRPQPAGTTQQHARRNYSTLLVLRKER